MIDPTRSTYDGLTEAYDFFNARLFGGRLPRCLITMQRQKAAYGYFAGGRFGAVDGTEITDEIALNPSHFRSRTTEESLSTLVHEMTHLEQHHFGKPSRNGYHNKQWAALMHAVGLVPSSTGAPGGKETGQKVSHYIAGGGPFDVACAELVRQRLRRALRRIVERSRGAQEEGREQDEIHLPGLRPERMGQARDQSAVRRLRRDAWRRSRATTRLDRIGVS